MITTIKDLTSFITKEGEGKDDGVYLTPWKHKVLQLRNSWESESNNKALVSYRLMLTQSEDDNQNKNTQISLVASEIILDDVTEEFIFGDVDKNGNVTISDERRIMAVYGKSVYTTDNDSLVWTWEGAKGEEPVKKNFYPIHIVASEESQMEMTLHKHSANGKIFYGIVNSIFTDSLFADLITTYNDVRLNRFDYAPSRSRCLQRAYEYLSNPPGIISEDYGGEGETSRVYILSNSYMRDEYGDELAEETLVTPSWNNDLVYCEDCGNYYPEQYEENNGAYDESRGHWVCGNCMDDLVYCEHCDTYHHCENVRFDGHDSAYCNSCWDERPRAVHSYDYRPEPYFWHYNQKWVQEGRPIANSTKKMKRLFYGTELEVEIDEDYSHLKQDFAMEIAGNERFLYIKEDGSLDGGFEIVSHPMTFEAFQNFDWEDRVLHLKGKLRGYKPRTTGMHVHMSKQAFSDNHLLKFMSMIYEYKSFTHLIAQRPVVESYNRWAKFRAGTLEQVKHNMVEDIKYKKRSDPDRLVKHTTLSWGEKYSPVNIRNSATIEVRVFKSNLNESSFRKNVEYCDALYYFTLNRPNYELKLNKFIEYVEQNKRKYVFLNVFLKDREDQLKEVLKYPLSIPSGLDISN